MIRRYCDELVEEGNNKLMEQYVEKRIGICKNMGFLSNRKRIYMVFQYIGIFLVFFLVQLEFLNDMWFASDEQDIMQGGMAIARGYALYRDFLSQHMPFSYYLSALFTLAGFQTIAMQRIAFYLFYAFMWTVIFARYHWLMRKAALFCYPLCFVCVICTYSFGTVVLSEHLAGIGFVILFLEYLSFVQRKRLKWSSCFMISLAILLTFGTIFIAAFGIFVIVFGAAVQELRQMAEKKWTLAEFAKHICLEYWKLGVCAGTPWIVYFIYLKVTGTAYVFYFSAYVMNRSIYSKYIGGFGSSILSSIFSIPANTALAVQSILFGESFSVEVLIQMMITVLAVMYLIHIFEKYGAVAGGVCTLFIMALGGLRGFYLFHGTQCVEVLCLMASCCVTELLVVSRENFKKKSSVYKTCMVLAVLIILSVYVSAAGKFAQLSFHDGENETAEMIAKITRKDEAVWNCTLSNDLFMQAGRIGLYNIGAVPWSWEAHGARILNDFGDEPPRVAYLDRNAVVWGYEIKDYGQDLIAYIDSHYICYEESCLYIRKDYYIQAAEILGM